MCDRLLSGEREKDEDRDDGMEPSPGTAAAMHDEWKTTPEGRKYYDELEKERGRGW